VSSWENRTAALFYGCQTVHTGSVRRQYNITILNENNNNLGNIGVVVVVAQYLLGRQVVRRFNDTRVSARANMPIAVPNTVAKRKVDIIIIIIEGNAITGATEYIRSSHHHRHSSSSFRRLFRPLSRVVVVYIIIMCSKILNDFISMVMPYYGNLL